MPRGPQRKNGHNAGEVPPVKGQEAVRQRYHGFFQPFVSTNIMSRKIHVSPSGEMAGECGATINTYEGPDGRTREEGKYLGIMQDSASLILAHGKDAILALAGRGVGVKTASRILAKDVEGKDLLGEILRAEKQFAKTKRFWKR